MTFTMPDPPASSYPWKTGKQIFGYPLATVFAATREEADEIAGPEVCVQTYDQVSFCDLAFDSTEAQIRLGIFGRPDLADAVMRGD